MHMITRAMQVDQTHWVLDVCSLVRQQYWEVKEVSRCLLVVAGSTLSALSRPSTARGSCQQGHRRRHKHQSHPVPVYRCKHPQCFPSIAVRPCMFQQCEYCCSRCCLCGQLRWLYS